MYGKKDQTSADACTVRRAYQEGLLQFRTAIVQKSGKRHIVEQIARNQTGRRGK